jgi:pimeloyl-ACP methyl ester carboxylesterase
MASLLACAIDLTRIGKTSFAIGPFDALSRASSVNCPTLIISGSEDALTRPWMANELTKAMGGHAQLVSLPGVGHNNMLYSGERLWSIHGSRPVTTATASPALGNGSPSKIIPRISRDQAAMAG